MSINIDEIRKKLAQLNGGPKGSTKFKRFKYEKPGEYRLRVIPFRNTDPGMPFPERIVYYGLGKEGKSMVVSPENKGDNDPIKEFRIQLFNDAKGKPEGEAQQLKDMAKKLQAKTITCVAVVDRAHEADGVTLWTPNFTDSKALLNLFLTEAGDYTDLKNGRDIVLVVSESKKINQRTKKPILEAAITVSLKAGPAAADEATLKKWLDELPDVDQYYPVNSSEDAKKKLEEWLEAGAEDDGSEGTSRETAKAPPKPAEDKSAVSTLVDSVKALSKPTSRDADASAKASKPTPSAKKPSKLLASVEDDLDRELADLENND